MSDGNEQANQQDDNTPDPLATLQAQLAQALETTRGALRAANPDLPDAAFTGGDLTTLTQSIDSARAVADHVRTQIETAQAAAAATNPGVRTPTGGGTTRQAIQVPINLHGVSRITFALNHPGPGMTE